MESKLGFQEYIRNQTILALNSDQGNYLEGNLADKGPRERKLSAREARTFGLSSKIIEI